MGKVIKPQWLLHSSDREKPKPLTVTVGKWCKLCAQLTVIRLWKPLWGWIWPDSCAHFSEGDLVQGLQWGPGCTKPCTLYGLSWWCSAQEPTCQCRRCRFDPSFEKIPRRREWYPNPVVLPEKSHGQRSLVGCSPPGHKRVRHGLATKQLQQ